MLADRLIAHRGYRARYPENTLTSLRRAIEAGARFVETDVLFSADCQPVLYHDVMMKRISGMNNAVHLLSLKELIECPAHEPDRLGTAFSDEKIAPLSSLATLLQEHPEVTAFVELKRAGLHLIGASRAYDSVKAALRPVLDQVVLISFDNTFIEYAHQEGFPQLGMVLHRWQDRNSAALAAVAPEYVFCNLNRIPEGASLEFPRSKLVVYEVGEPELGVDLFHRGADLLETFDIAGMLEGLARHAL